MKTFPSLALGVLVAGAACTPVLAQDAQQATAIAKQHNCLACHAVDKKLVGPAYQEVAAKYKGDPDAAGHLKKKIKEGGAGVWGPTPMPPNPGISDADMDIVVDWILAGAPAR